MSRLYDHVVEVLRGQAHCRAAGLLLFVLCALALLPGRQCLGTAIKYPHFSVPIRFKDRFTALSPDGKRVLCFSLGGRKLWQRAFSGRVLVLRSDDSSLYVQDGRAVMRIDVRDGGSEKLFDVPDNQILGWDPERSLAYLVERPFDRRSFQLVDPKNIQPLWKTDQVESLIEATSDLILAVTSQRHYEREGRSYSNTDAAILALDRQTGSPRWSLPLSNTQEISPPAVVTPACLVVVDHGTLRRGVRDTSPAKAEEGGILCIEMTTGKVLGRHPPPAGAPFMCYSDVVPDGTGIAFLEWGEKQDEAFVRFASLPSFDVSESVRLKDGEMFRVFLLGEFIVTSGWYNAACFDRRSGKRRWQRGQVGAWDLSEDGILFSDYAKSQQKAR